MKTTPLLALLTLLALSACDNPCADEDGDGAAASAECTKDMPIDCDDGDASVHPGADEICNGVDDDCDGSVDEEALDALTLYTDSDGDGYGDPDHEAKACEAGDGLVEDASDCDDSDPNIHPDATESCNELDDDCDGLVDAEDTDVSGTTTVYPDADGDGFGDATAEGIEVCEVGEGQSRSNDDCDDTNSAISPAATEVCDADDVDEDCDGSSDDADESTDVSTMTAWYPDLDGDGYGDSSATPELACDPSSGQVADASDCDDDDDQRPGVVGCYEGTWGLDDATIILEAGGDRYRCVGDVVLEVDSSGDIDGTDLTCTFASISEELTYDVYGAFSSSTECDGSLDFGDSGGPAYDFVGELTEDGTLTLSVDQTLEGVYVGVDWELEPR